MTRMGPAAAAVVGLSLISPQVAAQVDRPRFVFILDNSTSMIENVPLPGQQPLSTHGDGSQSQPGCDLDGKSTGNWPYDDSKLYQAKAAIIDTISAFGSAEFALATYARVLLGQPCQTDNDCAAIVAGAACVDLPDDTTTQKYCVQHMGGDYTECSSGPPTCIGCANPTDTNDRIFESRRLDCSTPCAYSATCPGESHCGISYQRLQFSRYLPLDRRQGRPASFHGNIEPRNSRLNLDAPGGQRVFSARLVAQRQSNRHWAGLRVAVERSGCP